MSTSQRRARASAGAGSPPGRAAAVVVNRDAGEALTACVASLRAAGVGEIVVVDNASRDGSPEALLAADPQVTLVPTGANLGYGSAANRGEARLGEAEFVLICNPDLRVEPDAVASLVAELDAHQEVAVVGPAIFDAGGERYPSARAFPSLVVGIGHALVGLINPDNRWTRRYHLDDGAGRGERSRDVDWVSGACFLVRRSAFFSVGGFDEGYFMYVEELDLCWRLDRAGWRVRYCPAARVTHAQGLSARRHPYRMLLAHHRSTWRFLDKSTSGAARAGLPFVAVGLGARLVVAASRQTLDTSRRRLGRAEPR